MRTKRFIYNSLFAVVLQFVTMISGFIIPRVILRIYGSEINGLVVSITQFVNYFTLVEAGLGSAAIYSLYKPLAEKNYNQVNGVLVASRNFYNKTGMIFASLVIILSMIFPFIEMPSNFNWAQISSLVIVIGASGALNFFTMSKYRVLLTADQKIYIISMASIIAVILNTIIIVVCSNLGMNIVIVRLIALSSVVFRSLFLWLYVKMKYDYVSFKVEPNYSSLSKRWDALYLQVLGSIQVGSPVVIATIFTSLKSVSIYSIYDMIFFGITGILSVLTNSLSSPFGDILARNQIKILQRVYEEFEVIYYIILTCVYSTTSILLMPFINIYTKGINDVNYFIPSLGYIFILNSLFYNIKTPQGMLVVSAGMFKETKVQTTIQGLIVVLGASILVQKYGLYGIVIASLISNIFRTIELSIFVPRNITHLTSVKSLKRMLWVIIIVTTSVVISAYYDFNISNIKIWIMFAIVTFIAVLVISILLNLIIDFDIMRDILDRFKHYWREKNEC